MRSRSRGQSALLLYHVRHPAFLFIETPGSRSPGKQILGAAWGELRAGPGRVWPKGAMELVKAHGNFSGDCGQACWLTALQKQETHVQGEV